MEVVEILRNIILLDSLSNKFFMIKGVAKIIFKAEKEHYLLLLLYFELSHEVLKVLKHKFIF